GHGVQYPVESTRVLFNFCRTDSEAVRLDHRVHSREEVQVTFLVSLHEVARKNDRFAREAINLPESFGGRFGRVPISPGYAATAVNKLARNTRGAIPALLVPDVEL